jgi:hypothetical protein
MGMSMIRNLFSQAPSWAWWNRSSWRRTILRYCFHTTVRTLAVYLWDFTPEFHESPFTSYPIYPENASIWQIKAPSISMRHHNGTEIFKYSFTGVCAQQEFILPYAAA